MGIDIYSFAEVYRDNEWQIVDKKIFPSSGEEKTTEPFANRSYTHTFLNECSCSKPTIGLPANSSFLNGNSPSAKHYKESCNLQGFGIGWLTVRELENQIEEKFFSRFLAKIYTLFMGEAMASRKELLEQTDFFEVLENLKSLGDIDEVRVVFYFM